MSFANSSARQSMRAAMKVHTARQMIDKHGLKTGYSNIHDWIKAEFGTELSRSQVSRMLGAGDVYRVIQTTATEIATKPQVKGRVSPIGNVLPVSEAQLRPLVTTGTEVPAKGQVSDLTTVKCPPARKTGEPDGSESGRKNPDFQLPRPVWRTAEEFENDGRIAVWLPVMNQVNLNQDHRAVREAIKRNQDENPLMSPTTVGDIVRNAFAMEIISKILHVMTMRGEEEWPDLELDKALSPEALTTALMGFCTIDSMVANGLADHLKNEAAA